MAQERGTKRITNFMFFQDRGERAHGSVVRGGSTVRWYGTMVRYDGKVQFGTMICSYAVMIMSEFRPTHSATDSVLSFFPVFLG